MGIPEAARSLVAVGGGVNKLTEPGEALKGAIELADEVLRAGPLAVRASKQVVQRAYDWQDATAGRSRWSSPAKQAERMGVKVAGDSTPTDEETYAAKPMPSQMVALGRSGTINPRPFARPRKVSIMVCKSAILSAWGRRKD